MHVYSQKSTRTTLPRSVSAVRGGEFTQRSTVNGGRSPAAPGDAAPRAPAPKAAPSNTKGRLALMGGSARLAPERENGRDQVVRALGGQEVPAALADRAALDAVTEGGHRRAQGVADAVARAERQHRHRQPLGRPHPGLSEPFGAEIGAVPVEARAVPGEEKTRTYSSSAAGSIAWVRVVFVANSQVR